MAWIHRIMGAALAGASLFAHAASGIQIQTPALLDPAVEMVNDIKVECGIERSLSEQAFEKIRDGFAGVRQTHLADRVASEPFLKLTVLYVYGASGGAWSGPKSIGLRAELLLDDKVVATQEFRQSSMGGVAGPFSGTCAIIERITKGLGEELAEWLPTVAEIQPVLTRTAQKPRPRPVGATTTAPKRHRESVPAATGYAAIRNFEPKAFAISESGAWRFFADTSDAMTKSLESCVEQLKSPCWLYAVDDRVVWDAEPGKRIGKPAPLGATAAPAPRAAASAVSPGSPEPTTKRALVHRLPIPDATGFANPDDENAVPAKSAKARYQHYLSVPSPKALVVYGDGEMRYQWSNPEAMTLLLDHCARQGKPCWLYAVDDRVVWHAEPDKRIGSSARLQPARSAESGRAQ
jgi:hypothetical protein